MQRQNSEYKESSARREERFLTPVRSLSANSIRVPPGIDNKLRDVHENRNILKDLLRDIHSKKSASLSLSNEEEQEEESLELTKTESGAIILKEDENKISSHNSFDDFDNRRSKPLNSFEIEDSFEYRSQSKQSLDNNESDEELNRLESFYEQEVEQNSVCTNQPSPTNSKSFKYIKSNSISCSEYLIQEQLKNFGSIVTTTPNVVKNENDSNDDRKNELIISKVKENDRIENSNKNSTPIPKIKSAAIYRPEVNRLRKRFHSLSLERNSFDLVSNNIFNSDSEIKQMDINLSSLNSDLTLRLSGESESTNEVEKTFSDYYLKELMGTPGEPTIIDPDIFDSVCNVMEKMLKFITRKMYLYNVGKFTPVLSDSNEYFFTKDDHIYDLNRFRSKDDFGGLEIYYDEKSETITEVSSSRTNEYFSYSKLYLDNEIISERSAEEAKERISISSEDYTIVDSEEQNILNNFIKDELRIMSTNFYSKEKLTFNRLGDEINNERCINSPIPKKKLQRQLNVLHDDFLLAEYNEKIEISIIKEIQQKRKIQLNTETLKPQQLQQLQINNNQSTNKITTKILDTVKKQSKNKSNILKKREERIKMMKKAFEPVEKKEKIVKIPAYTKSNITIKLVPHDYKQKFSPDLKLLPKIKPAVISQAPETKRTFIIRNNHPGSRAKTAPVASIGPIDERQKYPRPATCKQPWGTINHPPYGLGYQRMTPYEIQQSVERLYKVPKKISEKSKVAVSCLPKTDFYNMIERLTFESSDKAADRNRTQDAGGYNKMGVLNSYAWKGYH